MVKKIKSIKFHDFEPIVGGKHTSLNVRFYDIDGNLIVINTSDCVVSDNGQKFENLNYIFTSTAVHQDYNFHGSKCAFNTGNFNINYKADGRTMVFNSFIANNNDFCKIEFKNLIELKKMTVCNSFHNSCGFNKCNYLVEYEDGETKDFIFNSNGKLIQYDPSIVNNRTFNQTIVDNQFFDAILYYEDKKFDTNIAVITTNDTNCFRNVSKNIKNIKCSYTKPKDTYIKFIISFDKRNSWKVFDGNWNIISDISENNIFNNGIDIEILNMLTKQNLIDGGFNGDIDFKIIMKTDNNLVSPSIRSIIIKYD